MNNGPLKIAQARLIYWSLLPGILALTLLMAFATDVIVEDLLAGGRDTLALAAAALAAITMAGAVLTAHAQGNRPNGSGEPG